MTQATYKELSELRIELTMQIEAIDVLLKKEKQKKSESTVDFRESIERMKSLPKKSKRVYKKLVLSKQEATDLIINTIKVHNNVPLCVDELVNFSPLSDEEKSKAMPVIARTLTSLYYGNVLHRVKKESPKGNYCYHYNFP